MDFSDETVNEILKIFQAESEEIISRLNNSLLELEKRPNNKDAILMLFRDAHSLKGASRMVGFNNVQAVAHKMEDVLGLAKEDEITLNAEVVNVLYKTADFLSELIQKSIEKGKDVYSEDVSKHIELLENAGNNAEITTSNKRQTDFEKKALIEKTSIINTAISESLFILMKTEQKQDEDSIKNLLSNVNVLYEVFKKTGPYEIKKTIEDIKVKLEFMTKASNNITIEEIKNIHQNIYKVINKLSAIYKKCNIEEIDYYSSAFEKLSKIQEDLSDSYESDQIKSGKNFINDSTYELTPEKEKRISDDEWRRMKSKLDNLPGSDEALSEVKTFLIDLQSTCKDNIIRNIAKKIINILSYAQENAIEFNEEIISALKQSFEYCNAKIEENTETADKDSVIQRLEIIQQVLELNKEKIEEEHLIVPKLPNLKDRNLSDFSEIFTGENIKTLRVDSSKLDVLINQVNELTITQIKAKKHLHELESINKDLEEWQKSSAKTLNYLRYYDKKYFHTETKDSHIYFFIKQLLNLFVENNKKIQESVYNISTLQRTIQENDIKMGVIVDNIEDMVKNIRVLPLAAIFHLFGRMVRDIAQEKNKQIDFEILGSETCTDKKIIEEIKNPLIHIIRNSIDHGIETPEERKALGKKPAGKIVLSARQTNNKVIIEIKDDGRGINLEKIKEKASQKGFLTKEELNSMTDEQIMNIIFAPGFSTGEEITSISGRGIGLDIVQTKIAQLNGKVRILSEINKGCAIQIELPTAMSILKVFLVEASNQIFAIPMDAIKTVLRKNKNEIIQTGKGKSILFKNETIALFNLSDVLNLSETVSKKDKETIIILESDSSIIALTVEKLIGDQEILHKKLAAPFYKLKNIAGITTLDSGEISLILNVSDIIKTTASIKTYNLCPGTQKDISANSYYKILLVDDSITTRTLLKNILNKSGYTIELAQNPLEALKKIKETRVDLIISDIEMPEMNGFTFLEKLKTDEMFSDIPVIIISSVASEKNKKRALDLGAEKYIIKGEFDQTDFQTTINAVLSKHICD